MEIKEAFQQFLQTKLAEGAREKTISWYRSNFNTITPYFPDTLEDVQSHHVIAFLASERERGMTQGTLVNRYRCLNTFFNWCEMDVMKNIKRPKYPKQLPRRASYENVLHLIKQIPTHDLLGMRDKAIISTMLDTGMRVGEVTRITLTDLDISERTIAITTTKDDDPRIVPFTDKTSKLIAEYLWNRPATEIPHLFISQKTKHAGKQRGSLTTSGIRRILERRCQETGTPPMNPHSLRHLFATKALNNGMRVEVVSKILGHSSVDLTIDVYAPLMTETIQREYAEYWS